MFDYFRHRYFDNIPAIPCSFESERNFRKGEDGYFGVEMNENYDEEKDELLDSPEYNKRFEIEEGFGIDYGRASWTDPLNHPNLFIKVSMKHKDEPLQILGILLHELTHYWCWYCGYDYGDGNREFENKLKELGLPSNLDYGFQKENRKWVDVYDYSNLQHYYDEFKASLNDVHLSLSEKERQQELMDDLHLEQLEQMG